MIKLRRKRKIEKNTLVFYIYPEGKPIVGIFKIEKTTFLFLTDLSLFDFHTAN